MNDLDEHRDYTHEMEPPSHGCRVALRYLEPGQQWTFDRASLSPEYVVVRQAYAQTICRPCGGGPETGLDGGRMVSVREVAR